MTHQEKQHKLNLIAKILLLETLKYEKLKLQPKTVAESIWHTFNYGSQMVFWAKEVHKIRRSPTHENGALMCKSINEIVVRI